LWEYLQPLHGENGGPLCCLLCLGKCYGQHGKRRKAGACKCPALNLPL
jgi:hypothetical protein